MLNDAPRKAVATVGMFDGVHAGHRCVIDRVAALARRSGRIPMAVTFADHPMAVIDPERAPKLLMDPADKAAALVEAGIEKVVMLDFTPELRSLTAAGFIGMLNRDYGVEALVVGFNNRLGSDGMNGGSLSALRPEGVEIEAVAECAEGVSSSAVRAALGRGDVAEAEAMLGRPYRLSGTVVGGHRIGRTIGFPTANVDVGPRRLMPAAGVYAADVTVDGCSEPMRAMLNIGRRPTVDAPGAPLTCEVHILGRSIDLYGHRLHIDFLRRLRDERRFDSLDRLRRQLEADAEEAGR